MHAESFGALDRAHPGALRRWVRVCLVLGTVGFAAGLVSSYLVEPFFSTRGVGRLGLGLATVHGILEAVGGSAEVEATPAGGTRVATRWPAHTGSGGAGPGLPRG